jgi:OmpA-OmpF porin, OOP family
VGAYQINSKIMKKQIALIGTLIVLLNYAAKAQFSIGINGGYQGLKYSLTDGKNAIKPGMGLDFGFTKPFKNKHWAIFTGLGANYYNTSASLNSGTTVIANQVDDMGAGFEYRIKSTGYKESQRFIAINLPLMLQLNTGSKEHTQWQVSAGAKLIMPLSIKASASAQQLNLSGYYPDVNLEVANLPQHGFGTVNNWQGAANYKLKPGIVLSAATGINFHLSGGKRLYAGIFVDKGINDMKKNTGSPVVSYNPININGTVANSLLQTNNTGTINLLAVGVQLRLQLGNKKKKRQAAVSVNIPSERTLKINEEKKEELQKAMQNKPAISSNEINNIQEPISFVEFAKTDISKTTKLHLDEVAMLLYKYMDVKIKVTGHTCDLGTDERNHLTGLQRAEAVSLYLQNKGIASTRIITVSEGKNIPAVPNTSEANRSINRRVTIEITNAPGN